MVQFLQNYVNFHTKHRPHGSVV